MSGEPQNWAGLVVAEGRYRFERELGRGGMGAVYLASDLRLNEQVVIKVPKRSMLEDPEFSKRFSLEIRSLVQLRHPHILRILDVTEYDGIPLAVMQYMPGGDLDQKSKDAEGNRTTLSAPEVAALLPSIADALDFAHSKGFIHRDVKPGNILFDEHDHAFLSDFGIAKVMTGDGEKKEKLTGTGMVLGTADYMAPELIMGKEFDGRVDQYALAVMTYELLCGQVPFHGATPAAILVNQATKDAVPLHELSPAIPRGVSDVVMKGFAKDPADRYADCKSFSDAIRQALQGQMFHSSVISQEEISRRQTQTTLKVPTQRSPVQPIPRRNVPRAVLMAAAGLVCLSLLGWLIAIVQSAAEAGSDVINQLLTSWPFWGVVCCTLMGMVGLRLVLRKKRPIAVAAPQDAAAAQRRRQAQRRMVWTAAGVLLIAAQVVAGLVLHPLIEAPESTGFASAGPSREELLEAMPAAFHSAQADFTNKFGFRMVAVTPGKYATADGTPATIDAPFWISAREVTVAQYLLFMEDRHGSHRIGDEAAPNAPRWLRSTLNMSVGPFGNHVLNQFPVTEISAADAEEFCVWLTRSAGDGLTYRLPTRSEWICAYRGGTSSAYYWGDRYDANHVNARCTGESTAPNARAEMAPVGQFPAPRRPDQHPWNLFDMAGNVAEFVLNDDLRHVACGGGWQGTNPAEFGPVLVRDNPIPADDLGFRVVAGSH